ncbi:helix-turn-helix domain-containing protein [Actinomadura rubrisoli]|uniref:AraC family transcriptional regulator n=1 Tax=Actinomadura rubrisoli TaxID=2530368 RepID=A0A4R5CDQ6_9ACTN|nr:AraC family transcriptional regulator [Actinomadura rubrisoli]TDD95292.1 AraC family transcriptional regulator [Actinomadura rubrisoli]
MGALKRFSVLRSAALDEFNACVSQYLTPHRLVPAGRGGAEIRTDLSKADLGPLSLVYGWHRNCELNVQLTEEVDYYDVNLSFGGYNRIRYAADEVLVDRSTAAIISPRMRVGMRLSTDYRQLHVRIERYALERRLEELLDRSVPAPIRFQPDMDLRRPAANSWLQAVRLLVRDLDQPSGLTAHPVAAGPWAGMLMTGLLLAQPHTYSEQLADRGIGEHRPAPLRRAIAHIDARPEEELPIDRLAQVAGVTARSLQRHFREHVGISPREYVQQTRLARAHDELRSVRPGSGVTVAEVAFRWGFTHLPRFAAAYHARYGQLPSATLRAGT